MTTQDDLFESYLATLRARHEQGRKEYGDQSMHKPRAELLGEMQQELVDVAGWAFFEWAKLEKSKDEPFDREAVDRLWFRRVVDLKSAHSAEIASLRAELREALTILESWQEGNTYWGWERLYSARDAFIERHKEKSDDQ